MKKKIIGYKFKKNYKQYKNACKSINTSSHNYFTANTTLEYIAIDTIAIKELRKAKVLDLWFEPVYTPKSLLPLIDNQTGVLLSSGKIHYGFSRFDISLFTKILDINKRIDNCDDNRKISSIILDSGIKITIEEIQQINDYFNNNK